MATPRKPARYDRNLIVIGAGAAGLVTAYIAAAARAKVTLVEAGHMGGECLNTGCVPSKALIRGARLARQIRRAADFGLGGGEPVVHWRRLMQRVQAVVQAIAPNDSVERYTALGVEVLSGRARLLDPWTVEVQLHDGSTRQLTTRSIVLATGAGPAVPAIEGIADVGYLTSETLWDALAQLDAPPGRLLVLGAGPMGCELAQALQSLGSQVTLLEQGPRLLPREDEDVAAHARQALEREGVRVLTGQRALRFERTGATRRLWVDSNAAPLEFDTLLCATGRQPRLESLGLEELGIVVHPTLQTNAYLQTIWPHVYVAGDVASPLPSTPVAAHQAWHAAINALFGSLRRFKVDYSVVPQAIYLEPEIARVGLTEQQARARGVAYELTRFELGALDRSVIDGDIEGKQAGYLKLLTVPGKDRLLGVTIVGEHAAELQPQFTLALRHGLGLNALLRTLHAYPTLGEAGRQAAGQWRRAHVPRWLLPWLARYHAWRRG